MSSSIQRGGYWWNQRPDGVWLRWSSQNSAWEPQEGPPPPPGTAPPPPAPGAGTTDPSDRDAPAGSPAQVVQEESGASEPARSAAVPEQQHAPAPDQAQGETRGHEAQDAEQQPQAQGVSSQEEPAESTAPAPLPRVPANGSVFSGSGRRPRGLFESRGVLGALATALVVVVFVGTYMGANFFFNQLYGPQVAHATEKSRTEWTSEAKRRYIAKQDRFCERGQGASARFQERLLSATSVRQVERLLIRLAELTERSLDRFESVPKPKQDRNLLNRIIKLQRSAVPLLDRMLEATAERNSAAIDAVAAEAYASAAESARLMELYGFEVCGTT